MAYIGNNPINFYSAENILKLVNTSALMSINSANDQFAAKQIKTIE